jgi:hypothetical protein
MKRLLAILLALVCAFASAQTGPPNTPTRTLSTAAGVAVAWVRFTGATGAIVASKNVTSVTRNAAGDYTINFTTALTTANFVWAGNAVGYVSSNGLRGVMGHTEAQTTSTLRIVCVNGAVGAEDPTTVTIVVFSS